MMHFNFLIRNEGKSWTLRTIEVSLRAFTTPNVSQSLMIKKPLNRN
jgi:hypothetical protein